MNIIIIIIIIITVVFRMFHAQLNLTDPFQMEIIIHASHIHDRPKL